MTWHKLTPVDESFLSSAPIVHTNAVDLPASVAEVWESLASEESIGAWGVGVKVTWTSPRPFAVGATREVVLPGKLVTVRESFFIWEECSRFAYFVDEANRNALTSLAEEYRLEEIEGGCRLTWTMAVAPNSSWGGKIVKLTDPVASKGYPAVLKAGKKYFAKQAQPST